MKKYTRKSTWITHLGNTVSVEGISDEHLANTIQFLEYYKYLSLANSIKELKKEAKRRKLDEFFLALAPYPYKDGLGNYLIWSYANNKPKVVGSYVRG